MRTMRTMRTGILFCSLTGVLPLLLCPLPAAAPSPLNCSVSHTHSGFRYQLSDAPNSSSCITYWEDQNKTSIAYNNLTDEHLVQSRTDRSITLTDCRDGVRYGRDCSGVVEEAVCRVNCSLYDDDDAPPVTGICFSSHWCTDNWTGGLIIGVLVGAIVLCLVIRFGVYKCRRRRSLYTAAHEPDDMMEDKPEAVP